MMYKLLLSSLLSLLSCIHLSAQPLVFKNITRSNGLPVDEITTLAQDSTGFIWIGTMEGLFRYDGFSFKNFSFDGTPEAQSTSITRIIVDKKGRLWLASLNAGISCISASGKPIRLVNSSTSNDVTLAASHATDVQEDRDGNIWWTTTDGLYCMRANDGKIKSYRIISELARGNSFSHIDFDANGNMWVSGVAGLKYFNKKKGQLEPAGENVQEQSFFGTKKDFAMVAFQDNTIWYSNWSPELGGYNRENGKAHVIYSGHGSLQPDFNKKANTIFVDSRQAVWIGTGKGLHWIKKDENQSLQSFKYDPNNQFSLVNDKVSAILEDRDGNFWFATKKGISITRPYSHSMLNVSGSSQPFFPFADKEINDVINVDDSTLLIGTHEADGLYMTDLQFRSTRHWQYNDVAYDWIWRFFDDSSRNRILISTQEGMLIFDKRNKQLYKAKDTVFDNFYPVTSFVRTSDSIVWMTRFWNKLMRYNLETGKHKIYDLTKMGEKPQVLYLGKDLDNRLWICAHQVGLLCFDPAGERIVERLEKNNGPQSILETTIFSFLDIGEYYMIGYRSKGVSLYHKSTKTFRHLTKESGLVSNTIRDMLPVDDGTVWIATKNGITHYYPATGVMNNYNYENGILNNDFFRIRQLKDGRIVAASAMGLISFFPGDMDSRQSIGPPMITDIRIYGQDVSTDSLYSSSQPLRIGYGDNYFSFEYISLHYNSPQQVEYAYKLEGHDKDWIQAGSRRFVSYSRVAGGHYNFRVRARLPNGDWVESAHPVSIHVQTAFYKQWWFYALCLLTAIMIVYILFRYRVKQVLKVERMRTAISSDLHDEVGASLTSISLFSEMARQSMLPAHKKEEYLQRIGERSRDSIEQMSDIIWSINPENDGLSQMLLRMKNYALEVAEAKDIILQWVQSGKLEQLKLSMEQRKNFYLIFKEAINNAVKHAGAHNLEVNLDVTGSKIRMQVRDDGHGFDSSHPVAGNGLKNMQRRAAQLRGQVSITSEKNKGTTVQLQFDC